MDYRSKKTIEIINRKPSFTTRYGIILTFVTITLLGCIFFFLRFQYKIKVFGIIKSHKTNNICLKIPTNLVSMINLGEGIILNYNNKRYEVFRNTKYIIKVNPNNYYSDFYVTLKEPKVTIGSKKQVIGTVVLYKMTGFEYIFRFGRCKK